TSKFKFKVVEDADSGGLIIKRFERLSALRKGTELAEATDASISRWQRFKTVFKQSILDQTQGLRTTFRSARNTLNEAIEGGTLEGTKVGNFKRIRTIKTVVDPVTGCTARVAGSKQEYRDMYLGTSP